MILGINSYLVSDGKGQEAVTFYENALDAKVLALRTFGDMPENPEHPLPAEAKDRVLHAHLKVGNTDLMLSDLFPGQPHQIGSQVTIAININNVEKSREVFEKLQEDGQIIAPLHETFWSPLYGQVTDKFGVTWHISTQDGSCSL
ncbi:VOC family protein [Aneurinibacillus sp. REN35]|uniref:VOC family protein n=1 Tax=Aneurinibacillus sp. REN35 TaxID=3237286 RepID=UPI003528D8DE